MWGPEIKKIRRQILFGNDKENRLLLLRDNMLFNGIYYIETKYLSVITVS